MPDTVAPRRVREDDTLRDGNNDVVEEGNLSPGEEDYWADEPAADEDQRMEGV